MEIISVNPYIPGLRDPVCPAARNPWVGNNYPERAKQIAKNKPINMPTESGLRDVSLVNLIGLVGIVGCVAYLIINYLWK